MAPLCGIDIGRPAATDRFPLPPVILWGMYSSSTAWKLVPPKPKALRPARRTLSAATVHGFSSALTKRGEWAKSISGLGRWQFTLGGNTLSRSASTVFSNPAAPAAPLRCPIFDLTEPSATEPTGKWKLLSTSAMLCTSTTSPTRVDVPWPSINVPAVGDTPAFRQARSTASFWPTGLGAVMPFPFPSLEPAMPRSTA